MINSNNLITQEERNRILNLHESRSKKLYLSEQAPLAASTYGTTPTYNTNYMPKQTNPVTTTTTTKPVVAKPKPDDRIKKIQEKLKTLGYGQYLGKSGADGILGNSTLNAILLALDSPSVDVSKPENLQQKPVTSLPTNTTEPQLKQ